MNGYAVRFPPDKHSTLKQLHKAKEYKKIAWLYGCYQSGKTQLIRHVFPSKEIFEYPTVAYDYVEGEPTAIELPCLCPEFDLMKKFTKVYLQWADDSHVLTPENAVSWTIKVLDSCNEENFVRDFIKLHQENVLGRITWLVYVNTLRPDDRDFIDYLGKIHALLSLEAGKDNTPNLVFESRFSHGSSRNQLRRESPPTKPGYNGNKCRVPRLNPENIGQTVLVTGKQNTATVYKEALQKWFKDVVYGSEENKPAFQPLHDVVKEWGGYHFGSLNFVLSALKENLDDVVSVLCSDVDAQSRRNELEDYIRMYIEENDDRFDEQVRRIQESLEVTSWHESKITGSKGKRLRHAGINISENDSRVRLIKFIEHYRDQYEKCSNDENIDENIKENTMDKTLVISALQLAKWLWTVAEPGAKVASEKVGEAISEGLAKKLKELFGSQASELDKLPEAQEQTLVAQATQTLSTFPNYSEKDLLGSIKLAVNKLLQDSNNYTMQDLHLLYQKYVNVDIALEMLLVQNSLNPQVSIAQKIVQQATVDRRLPELIQDMRGPSGR